MNFSLLVPEASLKTNHGYGVATNGIISSLETLGHQVWVNDPDAPVEIAFTQPWNWQWTSKDSYKIGYVPWESTRLPAGWAEKMILADEIWTTSDWCKRIFEKAGLTNVRVYHHGVESTGDFGWSRKRRRPTTERPFRFLHMGEPAPRKGGQLAYDAFTSAFADDDNVTLTFKAMDSVNIRGLDASYVGRDGGLYVNEPDNRKNVKVVRDEMEHFELVDLMHRHDVLVYPSYGEGFGLIPLQAMLTGMPVICTAAWAPYRDYLLPELRLSSRLITSPWPDVHTGNMYEPSVSELAETMRAVSDPSVYAGISARAYSRSFDIERDFDWITLTRSAFGHIFEKFSSI